MVERQHTPTRQSRPKYQPLMELGRGGMGVVHLAVSRGPQSFVKLVVLKSLKAQLVGDEAAHRMFLEEARISARLAHPNVVQVFEVIEVDGTPTMVMEYLEGQALHDILADHQPDFSLGMHLHVITKLLAGLHAAHELCDYDGKPLELVHRDVSPHNIFVLYNGQVKVLDFGIAKAAGSEVHTQAGELKGKIRYMAPEQLKGEAQDRRADLFAVGVMLWEALSRRRLWESMDEGDVMLSLLTDKIPPLPPAALVAPELDAICRKALQPRREDRYASAAEFQRELEAHLARQQERWTDDDLASFMQERFTSQRAATNRLIEAHLNKADSRPPGPDGDEVTQIAAPSFDPPTRTRSVRSWLPSIGSIAVLAIAGAAYWQLNASRNADRGSAGGGQSLTASGALQAPLACNAGLKSCDGDCVSRDRPDYGCGQDSCASCVVLNATARCNAQDTCDIAVCYQAFDNCDGDPTNGCEANVRTDPDNCGGCGKKCPPLPHAERGCGDVCTIWRCDPGYRDCNAERRDGCELDVRQDPKNCGHCNNVCARGERCQKGRCIR